jgi:hypothetical protein
MRSEIGKFSGFAVQILIALLISSPPALAESGVSGRIAWRGELVPGVIVSAYASVDGDFLADPVAVSEPAATDGTYRLWTGGPMRETITVTTAAAP